MHYPLLEVGNGLILLGLHLCIHPLVKFGSHLCERKTLAKKKRKSGNDELSKHLLFFSSIFIVCKT